MPSSLPSGPDIPGHGCGPWQDEVPALADALQHASQTTGLFSFSDLNYLPALKDVAAGSSSLVCTAARKELAKCEANNAWIFETALIATSPDLKQPI